MTTLFNFSCLSTAILLDLGRTNLIFGSTSSLWHVLRDQYLVFRYLLGKEVMVFSKNSNSIILFLFGHLIRDKCYLIGVLPYLNLFKLTDSMRRLIWHTYSYRGLSELSGCFLALTLSNIVATMPLWLVLGWQSILEST